jgi:hypothetical protein
MRWRGLHPVVKRLEGNYSDGIKLCKKEMKNEALRGALGTVQDDTQVRHQDNTNQGEKRVSYYLSFALESSGA